MPERTPKTREASQINKETRPLSSKIEIMREYSLWENLRGTSLSASDAIRRLQDHFKLQPGQCEYLVS
jgi:hypothetical protein